MKYTPGIASALASAACLVGATTAALAAGPTQADFDACNRMAQSGISAPSASPKTDTTRNGSAGAMQQAAPSQKPASEARVEIQSQENNSSGSSTTQTTRDQGTGPMQQAAPSQESASEARVAVQGDQLRGIADTSKDDPAYQRAYRQCMKERGF